MALPVNEILSLLRDQVWSFGGIIVAIVIYLIDQMRQSHKEIAYTVISDTVRPHRNSLERTIVLKIQNRGNESIAPEHYGSPIECTFGVQATVLNARVLETGPAAIKVPLAIDRARVSIPPLLLNRDEWMLLEFVVIDADALDVDVRISGKTRNLMDERDRLLKYAVHLRWFIIAALFVWILSFYLHLHYPSASILYYASLASGILFCGLATRSIIVNITALRYG